MKLFLGFLILINLIVISSVDAGTIYDVKSKSNNSIVIEAFEPSNHSETINNKLDFRELKQIATNHCNSEVEWDLSVKRGGSYNGVYQAGRIKSVTYTFLCKSNSLVETVKTDSSSPGFTRKSAQDYCLMLGYTKYTDSFNKCFNSKLRASQTLSKKSKSSENVKTVKISNSEKLSVSKQICLDLGFTSGTEKFGECVLEIMNINFTENQKQTNSVSSQNNTNNNNSGYSYQVDESEFINVIKNEKYYKYKSKYERTPDKELCIAFINRYSWYKNKTKNAARLEVIKQRELNCNKYMEAAYYDQKERDKELADATQDLFNSTVENYYGVSGDSSNKSRTHCTTTNVGGLVQVFCKEY